MIEYIYQECVTSKLGPIYVVTGAYHDVISNELIDAQIIYNRKWQDGMASSISYAMRSIDQEFLDGVIIILSDQVFLTSNILLKLTAKSSTSTKKIVNCQYQKGMGPPTYFDKSLFPELEQLSGDDGAKSLVKKYTTLKSSVDFPRGDVDLDTIEDISVLEDL